MSVRDAKLQQIIREERALDRYVSKQRERHDEIKRTLTDEHKKEIETLAARFDVEKEAIEEDYIVQLSNLDESTKEDLLRLRENFAKRYEEEQEGHDEAFETLRTREQKKVDEYRKKQEEQIAKLHEEYQIAAEDMRFHYEND